MSARKKARAENNGLEDDPDAVPCLSLTEADKQLARSLRERANTNGLLHETFAKFNAINAKIDDALAKIPQAIHSALEKYHFIRHPTPPADVLTMPRLRAIIEASTAKIHDRLQHRMQEANGEPNKEVSPPLTDTPAGTATNDIADKPEWLVWTHSDGAKRSVPERYLLPNVSLSAALRLWEDGNAARNIRPFRLLRFYDWEMTGEDPKSKNSSRHRFHHWNLVLNNHLGQLCNDARPTLTSPGMATWIIDYCLFIKAKENGVATVKDRKRKRAYKTQPMGVKIKTLYRQMVRHTPSKALSKEFRKFRQTVLHRR